MNGGKEDMKEKIVTIVVMTLVLAVGSVTGVTNQSNEKTTQNTTAVLTQPFSMQFHQGQTPIVQPTSISTTQNRKPGTAGSDTQVTNFTQADSHPWVEVDNNGNPMVVYDHDTGLGYHEIYLQRSLDGGKTWPADKRYFIYGSENTSVINPVIEFVDNGTRAKGTFQAEKLDPRFYSFDLRNIDDPSTWVVSYWENSSIYPWVGQEAFAMVGDHIGVWSYIGHIIWAGHDCNSTLQLMWASDIDKNSTYSGLFFYYPNPDTGYSFCRATAAAGTQYLYGAGQYNLPSGDTEIAVIWAPIKNLTYPNWKNVYIPTITGHHLTNPDLAASGKYGYLAAQTDEKGNNDILCYTLSSTGNYWTKHIVANSSDDEMYPSITAVGKTALCTFVKNGGLYMSKSVDGGVTWSAPERINDPAAQIIGGYHCANVKGPFSVWMDNRNANPDIYSHIIPMPWIALKKCSGGLGCKAEVANVGTADATAVEWNMHIQVINKIIINSNVTKNGTIDIAAGKTAKVKSGLFFGLGQIFITATVGGEMLEKQGKQFLIFSIVKK
jgi:hypothetical protein